MDRKDIMRLLEPIKRRIYLIIGRAILTAIKNTGKTQLIQVTGLEGETITDVERPQNYGFESYPNSNAEAIIVFLNGNRDQGLAVVVHDRDARPTSLSQGDVCVYSDGGNVILKTGDASIWKPNTIETCPFTGLPHGGTLAGITKLKGE